MKPIVWVGSTRKDLKRLPDHVQDVFGHLLLDAQFGEHPEGAKVLRGFGGGGVLELLEDHDGNTYRAVYTVRLADAIYVLHVFQKKSKHGRETPRHDVELIRQRLSIAESLHRGE